ncbi:uncharacterized protein LOC128961020 isoform X2 [Oppia nitens]|uniref:uncharacterized protein LOC128961020 isoform X2 n=1 Tax=Oppia nitens TaxID=1686743 RepID=UPI0023D979A5|nr:uncharacterized protein LOC128961020 isoform X2 [Oppia nitens]
MKPKTRVRKLIRISDSESDSNTNTDIDSDNEAMVMRPKTSRKKRQRIVSESDSDNEAMVVSTIDEESDDIEFVEFIPNCRSTIATTRLLRKTSLWSSDTESSMDSNLDDSDLESDWMTQTDWISNELQLKPTDVNSIVIDKVNDSDCIKPDITALVPIEDKTVATVATTEAVNELAVALPQIPQEPQPPQPQLPSLPYQLSVLVHTPNKVPQSIIKFKNGVQTTIPPPQQLPPVIVFSVEEAMITINKVKKCLNNDTDDIEALERTMKVSLLCPISNLRVKTPMRSKHCLHFDCFDADNYINIRWNKHQQDWKCPKCAKQAQLPDLIIDSLMQHILSMTANYDPPVENIIFDPNAIWMPDIKKQDNPLNHNGDTNVVSLDATQDDIIDILSDDDSDTPPPPLAISAPKSMPTGNQLLDTLYAQMTQAKNTEQHVSSIVQTNREQTREHELRSNSNHSSTTTTVQQSRPTTSGSINLRNPLQPQTQIRQQQQQQRLASTSHPSTSFNVVMNRTTGNTITRPIASTSSVTQASTQANRPTNTGSNQPIRSNWQFKFDTTTTKLAAIVCEGCDTTINVVGLNVLEVSQQQQQHLISHVHQTFQRNQSISNSRQVVTNAVPQQNNIQSHRQHYPQQQQQPQPQPAHQYQAPAQRYPPQQQYPPNMLLNYNYTHNNQQYYNYSHHQQQQQQQPNPQGMYGQNGQQYAYNPQSYYYNYYPPQQQ